MKREKVKNELPTVGSDLIHSRITVSFLGRSFYSLDFFGSFFHQGKKNNQNKK